VLEQAEQEDIPTAEMLRSFKELWSKLRTGLGSTEVKGRSR
jgi:hypothetical protein